MNFIAYPDRDLLMFGLADQLTSDLSMALRQRDRVTFCVPGGTTPGPVFDILSDVRLEWERVSVLLNDERWVPESHERSNAAQLRRRLLTGRASGAAFVPLYAPTATPEDALPALEASIAPLLPISVLLLGMGADMHTASLFPGADRLQDALAEDAPTVLAMRAPGAAEPRVTLTAPVLAGALNTHILITGQDKRDAIEAAAELPPLKAPVGVVLNDATVHWAP
ncbi:MAG: 6-phosphogluconolactonase [Rhodobacteraceae bacterium]|nr:6-phosphogluconolactonase [Paracoccaceae bacterium]